MRTYEQTHPWLTFQIDLARASYRLWLLLGEAQSKSQHLAGVPLLPHALDDLLKMSLAKGVHATTAIEGNTLTEDQVRQQIDGTLKLPPSQQYLQQEVANIIEASNWITDRVLSGQAIQLSVEEILAFNRLVLKDTPLGEDVMPGEVRHHSVGVGSYRAAPAEDCEYLLSRLCDWLDQLDKENPFSPEYQIALGILKAILAHIYLAWIHPFADGNGRTARLVELHLLLSAGVTMSAAHLLSNHYNLTRAEYYRQLDATHRSGGNIFPFIEYALRGLVDGLSAQIETIRSEQWYVHWRFLIYETFEDKVSPADLRKKWLITDLSLERKTLPYSQIRGVSQRVAEAYLGRSDKTLQRDLAELERLGLLERTQEGVRAKQEIVLAFMSPTRPSAGRPTV